MPGPATRYDVVVVGSGLAGLVAASRAAELGAAVLLIDKGGLAPEGNTQTTSGDYYTAGAPVASDPDELYARATRGGGARPDLALAWAENCKRALEWLEHVGVQVDRQVDELPRLEPRSSLSSAPVYRTDVGPTIVRKLRAFYEALHGVSMSRTKALKLQTRGRSVVGLEALDGTGKKLRLEGAATILATGGFQGNKDLLRRHVGPHADACKLMGSAGDTGDGLLMAIKVKAMTVNLPYVHAHLVSAVALTDDRFWPYPTLEALLEDGMVVDHKGRRFGDEGWGDVRIANLMASSRDPARAYLVFDGEAWERSKGDPRSIVPPNPWLAEKNSGLCRAEGIRELARQLGVDDDGLESTLEEFNTAASRRRLGQLAVPRLNNARPLKPPFYGLRVVPGIVSTMGGPLVNRRAAVIDENGRVIQGLFAAGDLVGGLMGGRFGGYVGGISQAAVTGLLAAESAHKLSLTVPA